MKSLLPFLILSLYLLNNVSGACEYKRVCYYENWAWYRPGDGKMAPEDIDPSLCTHIMYSFTKLNAQTLLMEVFDPWIDIDNGLYKKVTAFKNQGVKVLIAIGGWTESKDAKYSRMVSTSSARAKFVSNVVKFIEKHNFDGLDLDWEYPACHQGNCGAGPASDKANFALLAKELNAAFKPRGWELSAAVSASKPVIDKAYDVKALGMYLDFINVMTYDYHGSYEHKTGHVAPLYYHAQDSKDYLNSDYTMNYFHKLGAPKEKIIMGMPMYGQSFTLTSASNNGLNAATSGAGDAGQFTQQAGFLAYNEICDMVKNGWTVKQQPEMGPYAFKGKQWVSYDDPAVIRKKSEYVKANGFGGGMVWAMGLDDFKNRCGGGRYPLLSVITDVLGSGCTGGPSPPAPQPPTIPTEAPTPPAPAPPAPAPPAPAPPTPPGHVVCVPSDVYKNSPGMTEWCNVTCNNKWSVCPASHCKCS